MKIFTKIIVLYLVVGYEMIYKKDCHWKIFDDVAHISCVAIKSIPYPVSQDR